MATAALHIPPLPMSLIPREVAPPPQQRTESDAMVVEECTNMEPESEEVVLMRNDPVTDATTDTLPVQIDLVDHDDSVVSVPATPSAETLNNTMSLKQLKDRCVELGLSTAGKKMELAQRIAES